MARLVVKANNGKVPGGGAARYCGAKATDAVLEGYWLRAWPIEERDGGRARTDGP